MPYGIGCLKEDWSRRQLPGQIERYWLALRDSPADLLAEVRAVAAAMTNAAAPITSSHVAGTVCLDPVTLEPCDPPTGPGVAVSFLDGEVDLTADLTSGPGGQHKAPATPGKGA